MNRFFCALLLGTNLVVPYLNLLALPTQKAVAQEVSGPVLAQASRIDVSVLRQQLKAQDWRAADAETRWILETWVHPKGDIFSSPLATNIPPEVLQTLDQLWTDASGGRFGFSAQKQIWDQVRAKHPDNTNTAAKAFGDRVGWTRSTPDPENFVAPEWLTEPELKYSRQAPVGHLPWTGISWERISGMLNAQSCGSCMIDALYLQGDRFKRYLPVLFGWLSTALEAPLPTEGSWTQARLARSIDLRSLYSNKNCPAYPVAQAISPDSKLLAISSYSYEDSCNGGANNSTLALWNAERGTRLITLLRGQATKASSYRGTAQEPPTESNRIVGDVANSVAFTPDGRLVAGLSNGTIRLWGTDQGKAVRTISGHRYAVRAIAISSDGQRLASISSDRTIKLWNLQTGQLLRTITLQPSNGIATTLLISADGKRLATASDRNTLQLWDATTGQLIRTLVGQAANLPPGLPLAFSPNGQLLAAADSDRSIKLWNATTGVRLITLRKHSNSIQHLAFSSDSQQLASSEEKTAYLWNLRTYQPIHTLNLVQSAGHPVQPNNLGYLAFSPDGSVLATSSLLLPLVESEPIPRQGILLWNTQTGQSITAIYGVSRFQFSPNGQFLIANGRAVQLWQPYRPLISTKN
ncbi:GUN4 domain-containing protein [Trichocoleus sp. FACHB-262]|uniref:GUN4 domain-containing protein n=1 Tax=Trichocoleus sp. FACHB-262 TaxID=2692869 RepID=UPI001689BFEB|nr:GUN4 domain-containing protein [Trichocoleus sp. FACHB-262]MBD2119337.1 GUN4 domain-containing protein [Trichocoleus sp. FACHB-262]